MTDKLVWIDLEMTGLDPERHVIIEIATIITDGDLNVIEEGPNLIIHHDKEVLDRTDPWSKEHHEKSGLMQSVRDSRTSHDQAEEITLTFLKKHVDPQSAPLCGNTIWQDRRFIARHMKALDDYLFYRCVDVSSIKELVRRWYPPQFRANIKSSSHRALDDIRESIEELRYYREKIFIPPP